MKEPRHYLVIDDDTTNNLICNFTIKRFNENAVIHLFTSPEEALQFIETKVYQQGLNRATIFLDVNMPTMSGFEFLEEFRKLKCNIKDQYQIYMLTSSIEDFSSEAEKFPMVEGFLPKPLNISYLEEIHHNLECNKKK